MAGPHILVVDDMIENRELLTELLEAEGYRVAAAIDGLEAVEIATATLPALVVMDVGMPRLDGVEACRVLKNDVRTRLIPVVLVTALAAREDRIRGIAAGADDFISKPLDTEQLLARVRTTLKMKSLVDQLEETENVLVTLANAVEAKDVYTRGHSERVARLAEALAAEVGLDAEQRRIVKRAGLIHDIGKIGIPLEYLNKPGSLTAQEYAIVQRHTAIGFDICRPMRTLMPLLPLIRGHHERLDGSGYPDGLRDHEIPVVLRCLTVADIYDALTSARPYRHRLAQDEAIAILAEQSRAGCWDMEIVRLLERARDSAMIAG